MKNFFGKPSSSYQFKLLGISHLMIIFIFVIGCILILSFREELKKNMNHLWFRGLIGSIMIFLQISYGLNNYYNGIGSIQKDLPLSLCGAAMILSGILMYTYNEKLFSILYFWAVAGVSQALLTPNLGAYGPYHFRYYQFLFGHVGILWIILFMIKIKGYKIEYKDIFRSLSMLIIFSTAVLAFNFAFDANYLYLIKPPAVASMLDLFPEFPMNLPILTMLAFIYFHIAYLPFVITKKMEIVKEKIVKFDIINIK